MKFERFSKTFRGKVFTYKQMLLTYFFFSFLCCHLYELKFFFKFHRFTKIENKLFIYITITLKFPSKRDIKNMKLVYYSSRN